MLDHIICGCLGDMILGAALALFTERLLRWARKYLQLPWKD